MRHVLAPIREGLEGREDEAGWIIAAAGTVINPVSFKSQNQIAEERLTNDTAEKARESSWTKTEPFQASKIL
jgi:hypothetical protein